MFHCSLSQFIHSVVDGHLGCLQFFIANSAAVRILVLAALPRAISSDRTGLLFVRSAFLVRHALSWFRPAKIGYFLELCLLGRGRGLK